MGISTIVGVSVVVLLGMWMWRRRPSDTVSTEWLVDYDRRSERFGFDQVNIDWPINKVSNEQAWLQRYLLRQDESTEQRKRA